MGTGTPAGIIDKKAIDAAGEGEGVDGGAELFGRYQIIERLAVGGMAEILLARSLSFGGVNRTCVIKRILPQYSRDLTFVSMFIDEARITIGLDHKNIVKLYDFGQHDGVYFMAIEYLDGTDVAALMRLHLQRGRGVFPPLAAFIVREMCNGAHHAHTLKDHNNRPLGIVHRDVSPQNVLLSSTGEVKLTDFGIAAARHKLTLTSPGTVLGKAAYMAPEQAAGKPVDYATDVWAAGVILHEMLAGERLFADETPLATIQRVVHDPIRPPSMKLPSVPKELDRIVMKALERNPRERFSSAEAMAAELTSYMKAHPSEGHVYGEADLARALVDIEWSDDTARMRPSRRAMRSAADTESERPAVAGTRDPRLKQLFAELRAQPDLWTLVAIGDRLSELDMEGAAVSAYRTAAAVFAHRGLLVQSLCAYDGAKKLLADDEVNKDLLMLGDLSTGARGELIELLKSFDRHELWKLMQEADPEGLGSQAEAAADAQPFPAAPTPLFGYLGPLELARVGRALRVKRVKPGEVVIREGDAGDALFAVGRGRLVVYCKPGDDGREIKTVDDDEFDAATSVESVRGRLNNSQEPADRVYLAGLADGDFFGELSFLAERPRSATVEAITDSLLLQIDRAAVDEIVRADAAFTEPLLQFYKERVIELMMAKSPVFSLLEPHDRRGLLDRSDLVDYQDEEVVVEEGTLNDHLYFIKRGDVEIFRKDRDGVSIFINKLGAGQFFGEIAALKGTPRTVSVRAMGEVSLFKISSKALLEIVERQPRLKTLLDATIASRTAEMKNRVREHQRLFFGT